MANAKPELDCTTCALGDVITVTSLQTTGKAMTWHVSMVIRAS